MGEGGVGLQERVASFFLLLWNQKKITLRSSTADHNDTDDGNDGDDHDGGKKKGDSLWTMRLFRLRSREKGDLRGGRQWSDLPIELRLQILRNIMDDPGNNKRTILASLQLLGFMHYTIFDRDKAILEKFLNIVFSKSKGMTRIYLNFIKKCKQTHIFENFEAVDKTNAGWTSHLKNIHDRITGLMSAVFSPDGKILVTCGEKNAKIFNLDGMKVFTTSTFQQL